MPRSLAVVGICTNHTKSMLLCSFAAQKLSLLSVLWLIALNADGVLLLDKGLTGQSTTQTIDTAHNPDSNSTQYVGAWFDWGAPKGGDAWAKQKTKIREVAERYRIVNETVSYQLYRSADMSLISAESCHRSD